MISVGMSLANLGRLRLFENRVEEAVELAQKGLALCSAQLAANHPAVLAAQMAAGGALAASERYAEALPLLEVAADAYEQMLPPRDTRLAETYLWRGIARAQSDPALARADLERALETFSEVLGSHAPLTRRAEESLAMLDDV